MVVVGVELRKAGEGGCLQGDRLQSAGDESSVNREFLWIVIVGNFRFGLLSKHGILFGGAGGVMCLRAKPP